MNKEIGAAYQDDPFFVELRDRWAVVLLASKFLATQKHVVDRKQVAALATAYAKDS